MPIVLARNPLIIPTPPPPPPPPPSSSGNNWLLNPSAHGYADATNSGYLNYFDPTLGRNLKFSDLTQVGSLTTTAANQVIERMHITGQLTVKHPGVKVRGCLIERTNSSTPYLIFGVTDHNQGLSDFWPMTYCTLIGHPTFNEVTMMNTEWCNWSWCDVSGGTDAWDPWGAHGVEVHHNFIHDLVPFGGSHSDCFQIVSGSAWIHHNTMFSTNPSYPVGAYAAGDTSVFPGNTSGLQIGKLTGQLGNVLFEENICDGGNQMFNANWSADTPDANGVTHTQNPGTTVTIRNNRFGRDERYGLHGSIPNGHSFDISNNVWDDDGSPAWG